MAPRKPVIAIAGGGDMSKYLVEEIAADGTFEAVVLTSTASKAAWFQSNPAVVAVRGTDYSTQSLVAVLDEFNAFVMYALWISWDSDVYVKTHNQIIDACIKSKNCKKYHGSELLGDV
ncbi:hypothetical protein EJ08DRAFT_659187 [Tothia fuscella]|uniref:NmrA-like domain-containing protein n=1 Tax=Tothia fuscella TaxID=1048955 RepID=A0A9P4U0R3_9PEZI|nr:hypothetical protein EJ08DRAFT_659187 [Tothia fuscella]